MVRRFLEKAAGVLYRFTPLREIGERLEYRLNSSAFLSPDAKDLRALFDIEGPIPVDAALRFAPHGDLVVFLTTYDRPQTCERVVRSLKQAAAIGQVHPLVVVVDDGSKLDYGGVRRALGECFPQDHVWVRAKTNLGKRQFWKIYSTMFALIRSMPSTPALFLQDDIEFEPDIFLRLRALRQSLACGQAMVLNLFACPDDNENGQWLMFRRRTFSDRGVNLTQWFDLQCFWVEPGFFEVLGYRIFPVSPHRWSHKPSLSSGVGRQLTLRLWNRGNIYQVIEPLAFHGGERSLMNPEARARRSLDNRPKGQPQSRPEERVD